MASSFEADGTGIQHFHIMKLEKIGDFDADLYETTLGGMHFFFSVRIAGNGHYFISAHAALEWADEERERRAKAKKREYAKRYYDRHRR